MRRRNPLTSKSNVLHGIVTGALATALAFAGVVVFATEASAHNNIVTTTAPTGCNSPSGTGATITWLIANDFNEPETGTASANGGSMPSSFGIAASPGTPFSTTTLTQTFTASQLATQLSSNPTITFQWSTTWTPDNFHATGSATFGLSTLPNGCTATPALTTSANPTNEVVGGGALADSATLSNGSSPTGTITFYLFSPSQTCSITPTVGSYTFKQAFSVDGNGSYGPTSGGPNPTVLGTWHWLAVYSGDSANGAANSGCMTEPVTDGTASPTVTTSANPKSDTVGGAGLNDSGVLSGGFNPTGTITFYLFSPTQTCSTSPASGTFTFSDQLSVDGNGTYNTTGGPSPTTAGTWSWVAVYSGDANNNGANSGCATEPVTVTVTPVVAPTQVTPTTTTTAPPTTTTTTTAPPVTKPATIAFTGANIGATLATGLALLGLGGLLVAISRRRRTGYGSGE
jgi:hypothetical protein